MERANLVTNSERQSRRDVFLIDRNPEAVTVHLVPLERSCRQEQPNARAVTVCTTRHLLDLLAGVCVDLPAGEITVICPAAIIDEVSSAVADSGCTRLVLPSPDPSTVLRISTNGTELLRLVSKGSALEMPLSA
jgi:hypothetical protein